MNENERYDWNENPEQGNFQEQPYVYPVQEEHIKKPKKKKNDTMKKAGMLVLCAVLFGGTAGGTFAGVTKIIEANGESTASASDSSAKNGTEETASKAALQKTSSGESTTVKSSIDVSDIAENAMPSIVSITNKSVQEVQNYFSMFGRGATQTQEVESCGSGIIIGQNDTELLLVTNNHVVEDADQLSVCFIDNEVYEATIKGTDSSNDLAVIAVALADISESTMSQIKIIQIGDSDELRVGEQVVAIGNALGYGQSVTTGIVSAVNRQVEGTDSENGFLQTDAAINPGNSGGALLNMNGELIGINSAKLASTEIEGMGYAIPINTASPIIETLMNRVTREKVDEANASALGISGQTVDGQIAAAYGIPKGVYVGEVNEGGAAEKAGIVKGCVITKFDDIEITSIEELKEQLTYYAAGEVVDVTISIANNGTWQENTVSVTLDRAQTADSTEENTLQGIFGR